MNKNILIVAAAGSGKTTFLVNEALKQKEAKVLITTYTQANEAEIRKKIIEINKCIPENLTVQTWFSFLLQHGVKPYQGCLYDKNINGLILVNSQSAQFVPESNIKKHYLSNCIKIFSDKISKFVFKCNQITNGEVINRLNRIYTHIFIDEVQDLAGYDLDLLKLLFECNTVTLLVGDPRQGTYSTNSSSKNKKFKKSNIVNFFEDSSMNIETNTTSLTTNYRSIPAICNLSNKLFPHLQKTTSGNNEATEHDGVFIVKKQDIKYYLEKFKPMQLRDSKGNKDVDDNYNVMNFGESKGLSFDRVLIYPTKPFIAWLHDNQSVLAPTSRSKFYVAITRARYSVGIVYDFNDDTNIDEVTKFKIISNC